MTDRSIIFSAPMIRALLDGRKTQTRRLLKPQPPESVDLLRYYGAEAPRPALQHTLGWFVPEAGDLWPCDDEDRIKIPYAIGDRLWVTEAHYLTDDGESGYAVFAEDESDVAAHLEHVQALMSSHPQVDWSAHIRMRPPTQLPRWASRLTLIVTDVRVQQLQDISADDAKAEGVQPVYDEGSDTGEPAYLNYQTDREAFAGFGAARLSFTTLWNSLHDPDAWNANPWVAAITFTVHKTNIDQMEDAA